MWVTESHAPYRSICRCICRQYRLVIRRWWTLASVQWSHLMKSRSNIKLRRLAQTLSRWLPERQRQMLSNSDARNVQICWKLNSSIVEKAKETTDVKKGADFTFFWQKCSNSFCFWSVFLYLLNVDEKFQLYMHAPIKPCPHWRLFV